MHVDAVLILRRLVGEIVGEAEHAREFVPGLRIEIGVAAAGVDRPVPDADVRQARRVVGPDRDVSGDVSHVVMNARVPAQRRDRQDIAEASDRVADCIKSRERQCAQRGRQRARNRPRQRGAFTAVDSNGADSKLASEHRRGEGVGWHQQAEIGSRLEACVHVRGEIEGDSACLEFACAGDVGTGRHAGMIIDRCERPSRLLRSRCEAAEEAGKPEAHAAFVCGRDGRQSDDDAEKCRREGAHKGAAAAAATGAAAQQQQKRPNIVMLMTDDTGWNDFGAYTGGGAALGHPTPNIDRIAKEGAVFTSWYGQASCTAGRASFMTGRIPIRSALSSVVAPGDENALKKETPTIAEFFQKNGYSTYFSGKWHLGDKPAAYPIEHGFDEMKAFAAYYPGVYTYADTSKWFHPWFPSYNAEFA